MKNLKKSVCSFAKINDSIFSATEKLKFVHDLICNKEMVKYATKFVIHNFLDENVIYIELRATPKLTLEISTDDYVQSMVDTIV